MSQRGAGDNVAAGKRQAGPSAVQAQQGGPEAMLTTPRAMEIGIALDSCPDDFESMVDLVMRFTGAEKTVAWAALAEEIGAVASASAASSVAPPAGLMQAPATVLLADPALNLAIRGQPSPPGRRAPWNGVPVTWAHRVAPGFRHLLEPACVRVLPADTVAIPRDFALDTRARSQGAGGEGSRGGGLSAVVDRDHRVSDGLPAGTGRGGCTLAVTGNWLSAERYSHRAARETGAAVVTRVPLHICGGGETGRLMQAIADVIEGLPLPCTVLHLNGDPR